MGKSSRGKRQKELQAKSTLKDKPLKIEGISSKWSLFHKLPLHFLLIAIVGFLAYSNTFNVPFHFDDKPNIVENYKLRDLNNFWPPSGSRWLGFLTFALNYHFGGLNITGYHIVNLTIHILNAILVYWLVALTFKTPYFSTSNPPPPPFSKGGMGGFALFSALLFVSHPIQTQAVTYIVQRFTSLATMFYLLSLVMYIKARLEVKAKVKFFSASTLTFYFLSVLSAILAMKTKEIAFTLPLIITLYEFMFFNGKIKKRVLYLIPLILIMLIIPLGMIGIDKPIGDAIGELREAAQETEEIPRWDYLFTQFRVIITYIRLLFLPINQNLDYDHPIYNSFLSPNVFLSFLFLLSIFGLGVYLFYRSRNNPPSPPFRKGGMGGFHGLRLTAFGIFWFFITLSVESSIIPIKDVIFEHRVYLPSVGAIIAFSIAVFYVLQFTVHRLRTFTSYFPVPTSYFLLLSTIVIVFLFATYQRNIVWQDEVSLWEDVVKKSPNKARPHYNLGVFYENKRLDKAIEHYQIALRLKADYPLVYYNLGVAYKTKGWLDKAIEHYQFALFSNLDSSDKGTIHNSLGEAYYAKGWTDKAIEHYHIALRLKPDFADAHNNIGTAYSKKGLLEEAIKQYQAALRLNPEHKLAKDNLNKLLQIKEK